MKLPSRDSNHDGQRKSEEHLEIPKTAFEVKYLAV
jgi:hypothetical protein